jgi:DNA-binding response OmpR family regulator
VLVVDDNQDAADSLGELLSALGYRPSVAYDPAHAIALASAAMPDVAILDIGLPGMDGFRAGRPPAPCRRRRPEAAGAVRLWPRA